MTVIDEILICANQLANAGKKPTVALVKAKLTQRIPLATLITTLKSWQHQPDFIAPITNVEQQVNQNISTKNSPVLLEPLLNALLEENGAIKDMIQQSLTLELSAMKRELSEMKLLIKNLTEQLTKK